MKYIKKVGEIIEGVGDKYLQNKHIYINGKFDEFEDFNKKYNAMKLDKEKTEVIYRDGDWSLVKNPKTIIDFGKGCRGVILLNGDFYCETFSQGTIHNDILGILYDKGILKGTLRKNWGKKLPQESGFLTVQRYKDTDYIAIGESNRVVYDEGDWEEKLSNYDAVFDEARKKCPKIKFTNKLVGIKYGFTKTTSNKNSLSEADIFDFDQKNLMKTFIKNNL